MITAWTVALALPPAGSLSTCSDADSGPSLTLLSRVHGLRFDDDGALWVADAGSLTVRDPATLRVLRTPAPGVDRWRIRDDEVVSAAGVVVGSAGVIDLLEPKNRAPSPFPLQRSVTARAADPATGRHAYATPDDLVVLDASGKVLASQPIVHGVESVGFHSGRVFTVANGTLQLWNTDGSPAARASNWWASAAVQGTELVGTDRLGYLVRGVNAVPGPCVVDDCALIDVPAWRPPSPGPDPSAYGASVATWTASVPAPISRPTRIVANERAIVVGVVDPDLHHRHGIAAIRRLVVLDAGGRRIRREIAVEPPSAAPLALHADVVQLADRAWSVRTGKPTGPRGSDGLAVRVVPGDDGLVGVQIGRLDDDTFVGTELASRLGPQRRGPVVTAVRDRHVALAGTTRMANPAVEVWCVPSSGSSDAAAGWLTAPRAAADWDALLASWAERPAQPGVPGVVGAPYTGDLPGDRVVVLDRPADGAQPSLPEPPDDWHVVVRSPVEPADLPSDGVWQRAIVGTARVRWVVAGVVVWEGPPELVPPSFELGPVVPPTPAGRALWTRQLARSRPSAAPDREAALASALFDAPEEAGQLARQALARGIDHPVLRRVALHGQEIPPIVWERPPPAGRLVIWVGVDPSRPPWELADTLGLPVAWIDAGRTAWKREPHPTTPWGRSDVLGTLQEGSLLVVDDGRVVWTGTDRTALERWLFE